MTKAILFWKLRFEESFLEKLHAEELVWRIKLTIGDFSEGLASRMYFYHRRENSVSQRCKIQMQQNLRRGFAEQGLLICFVMKKALLLFTPSLKKKGLRCEWSFCAVTLLVLAFSRRKSNLFCWAFWKPWNFNKDGFAEQEFLGIFSAWDQIALVMLWV